MSTNTSGLKFVSLLFTVESFVLIKYVLKMFAGNKLLFRRPKSGIFFYYDYFFLIHLVTCRSTRTEMFYWEFFIPVVNGPHRALGIIAL